MINNIKGFLVITSILFGFIIYVDKNFEKPTDKYSFKVTYEEGYKVAYSYTNKVKNGCVITNRGKVCGSFSFTDNNRYKGK